MGWLKANPACDVDLPQVHRKDLHLPSAEQVTTHPGLRIAVVELLSRWLPELAIKLDLANDNHRRISGHFVQPLADRPSSYLRRQVRVSAFASEQPGSVMAQMGPMLMFGGDFPHPEGYASPLEDYRTRCRDRLDDDVAGRFFGGNLAELLHR